MNYEGNDLAAWFEFHGEKKNENLQTILQGKLLERIKNLGATTVEDLIFFKECEHLRNDLEEGLARADKVKIKKSLENTPSLNRVSILQFNVTGRSLRDWIQFFRLEDIEEKLSVENICMLEDLQLLTDPEMEPVLDEIKSLTTKVGFARFEKALETVLSTLMFPSHLPIHILDDNNAHNADKSFSESFNEEMSLSNGLLSMVDNRELYRESNRESSESAQYMAEALGNPHHFQSLNSLITDDAMKSEDYSFPIMDSSLNSTLNSLKHTFVDPSIKSGNQVYVQQEGYHQSLMPKHGHDNIYVPPVDRIYSHSIIQPPMTVPSFQPSIIPISPLDSDEDDDLSTRIDSVHADRYEDSNALYIKRVPINLSDEAIKNLLGEEFAGQIIGPLSRHPPKNGYSNQNVYLEMSSCEVAKRLLDHHRKSNGVSIICFEHKNEGILQNIEVHIQLYKRRVVDPTVIPSHDMLSRIKNDRDCLRVANQLRDYISTRCGVKVSAGSLAPFYQENSNAKSCVKAAGKLKHFCAAFPGILKWESDESAVGKGYVIINAHDGHRDNGGPSPTSANSVAVDFTSNKVLTETSEAQYVDTNAIFIKRVPTELSDEFIKNLFGSEYAPHFTGSIIRHAPKPGYSNQNIVLEMASIEIAKGLVEKFQRSNGVSSVVAKVFVPDGSTADVQIPIELYKKRAVGSISVRDSLITVYNMPGRSAERLSDDLPSCHPAVRIERVPLDATADDINILCASMLSECIRQTHFPPSPFEGHNNRNVLIEFVSDSAAKNFLARYDEGDGLDIKTYLKISATGKTSLVIIRPYEHRHFYATMIPDVITSIKLPSTICIMCHKDKDCVCQSRFANKTGSNKKSASVITVQKQQKQPSVVARKVVQTSKNRFAIDVEEDSDEDDDNTLHRGTESNQKFSPTKMNYKDRLTTGSPSSHDSSHKADRHSPVEVPNEVEFFVSHKTIDAKSIEAKSDPDIKVDTNAVFIKRVPIDLRDETIRTLFGEYANHITGTLQRHNPKAGYSNQNVFVEMTSLEIARQMVEKFRKPNGISTIVLRTERGDFEMIVEQYKKKVEVVLSPEVTTEQLYLMPGFGRAMSSDPPPGVMIERVPLDATVHDINDMLGSDLVVDAIQQTHFPPFENHLNRQILVEFLSVAAAQSFLKKYSDSSSSSEIKAPLYIGAAEKVVTVILGIKNDNGWEVVDRQNFARKAMKRHTKYPMAAFSKNSNQASSVIIKRVPLTATDEDITNLIGPDIIDYCIQQTHWPPSDNHSNRTVQVDFTSETHANKFLARYADKRASMLIDAQGKTFPVCVEKFIKK